MVSSAVGINLGTYNNLNNIASLMTVAQVARRLSAHPHSVRRWADSGLLSCYRIGFRGDRRFKQEDVEAFLVTRKNGSVTG